MTVRARRTLLAGAALVSGAVGLTGLAWACTAQSAFAPLPVRAGPEGTKLLVAGQSTQRGPVEIRWNGVKGPVVGLATADQGHHGTDFSAEVTIPPARPGVYYLMLVAGDAGMGRTAFQVTAPPGSAATSAAPAAAETEPWNAFGDSQDRPSVPLQSQPGLGAGMALLAVGSAALAAGAGVAGVRRTRVRVGSQRVEGQR